MGSIDRGKCKSAVGGMRGVVKGTVISMPGLNRHDDMVERVNIVKVTVSILVGVNVRGIVVVMIRITYDALIVI